MNFFQSLRARWQVRFRQWGRWWAYPRQAYEFIHAMLKEGGHLIETPFQFGRGSLVFRTLFQPDGTVLNFIPDLRGFYSDIEGWVELSHDPNWLPTYQNHLRQHHLNTQAFLDAVKDHGQFWDRAVLTGLSTANLGFTAYTALRVNLTPENWWEFAGPLLAAVGSYLARPWLVRQTLRLLMRLVGWVAVRRLRKAGLGI
ncbi:MAG: hypothetical protein MUC97_08610 [Bernardetiaceae bacterium]|nr:hypothetical protein [Bernardetiaceae bacterium]